MQSKPSLSILENGWRQRVKNQTINILSNLSESVPHSNGKVPDNCYPLYNFENLTQNQVKEP